ncbi:hypothetical protein LWI29_010748 [Acer saccharum]|uniref:ABC transporter domain-containing protein n=1 Tax=Acer saccharum TaxID=4024 RepID=A0AA39S7Y7_ACESA|nr:hypothetical protein LWI29_010748 [Acer saccharum]
MDWSIFKRSVEISWDASSSSLKATLRNISLRVKPGEKVAICGEVGSGKSTLLAAILGEVPKIDGTGHDHMDTDHDNNIDSYYTLLQSEGIRLSDNVTPFAEAGFFSTMSFWWLNPLVKKGKEKILEDEDIPELRPADQAQTCYSIYMEQMNKRKQKGSFDSPSMLSVILFCQWKAILVSGFLH